MIDNEKNFNVTFNNYSITLFLIFHETKDKYSDEEEQNKENHNFEDDAITYRPIENYFK